MRLVKSAILILSLIPILFLILIPIDLSAAKIGSETGFQPDVNEFSFANWGNDIKTAGLTPVEVQRMFGDNVIASRANGEYILKPAARRWMDQANKAMAHGHCEGMAVLSDLLYFGQISPKKFNGNVTDELSLQDELLQREIAYWWTTQVTKPGGSQKFSQSPNSVLDTLSKAFQEGKTAREWWVMGLYRPDGSGGHSVTPFAVEDMGNGTARILIYDNNFPKEVRAIEVDRNANTWRYQGSTKPNEPSRLYAGNASTHNLEIVSVSSRLGPQECDFCEDAKENASLAGIKGSAEGASSAQVWVNGSGHFLITDKYGRRIGFLESGVFVNEIPNANRTTLRLSDGQDANIYSIPLGQDYSINFGQNIDDAWIFAPGGATGLENQGNQGSVQFNGIGTQEIKAISQIDNAVLILSGANTETTFNNLPANTVVQQNTVTDVISVILGKPGVLNVDTIVINGNGLFSASNNIPMQLDDVAQINFGSSEIEIVHSDGTTVTYVLNLNQVIDCKVSEWSQWSECSGPCGAGEQTRSRTILTVPANGGQECPELTESRGCTMDGASCDDGDICTEDSCDPAAGCINTPISCDDGDPNTVDRCDPATGGCVHALTTQISCDDGDDCTIDSGEPSTGCVHTPKSCDDGNVCTEDSCNPAAGCVHTDNSDSCDDGNVCTTGDTCSGGSCQSGSDILDCNDGDVCTDDSCDPEIGCVHTDNSDSCDDGNACTADSCNPAAGCVNATISCDDGDACTSDSCDPDTGCVNTPISCDDGNVCTTGDICSGGSCQPGSGTLDCDEGNLCTDDFCDGPTEGCVHYAASCDDGNACTADSCNPATGCVHTDNSDSCDDGDACTDDSCDPEIGCVNTDNSDSCNDGNACTDDSCDPEIGCMNDDNTDPCDDGNACTTGDTCSGGDCLGSDSLDCDDGNACTDDSCDPEIGCEHTDNSDSCDDGNACTDDSCDPEIGCVNTDNTDPCDDGNACTTGDICSGGDCLGSDSLDCDDSIDCTDDSCDEEEGCVHEPNDGLCSDDDLCTDDSCDPNTGCVNTPKDCNDYTLCTVDSCSDGLCVHDPDDDYCSTGNICYDAWCDPDNGCVIFPSDVCDDGNACTEDVCQPETDDCAYDPVSCDDHDDCTTDSCDPATGCVHTPIC